MNESELVTVLKEYDQKAVRSSCNLIFDLIVDYGKKLSLKYNFKIVGRRKMKKAYHHIRSENQKQNYLNLC